MNREEGVTVGDKAAGSASTHHAPIGLRTVAIFEFAKGLIVLVAGLGLLSLIGHDVQQEAEQLVRLFHLNPARDYPRIFIDFASKLDDARLWFYSVAALAYAGVRFVEAYGLWHELAWAEWFAVLTSGMFLPVELAHLVAHRTLISLCVPVVNIGIVIYLARLLVISSRRKANNQINGPR